MDLSRKNIKTKLLTTNLMEAVRLSQNRKSLLIKTLVSSVRVSCRLQVVHITTSSQNWLVENHKLLLIHHRSIKQSKLKEYARRYLIRTKLSTKPDRNISPRIRAIRVSHQKSNWLSLYRETSNLNNITQQLLLIMEHQLRTTIAIFQSISTRMLSAVAPLVLKDKKKAKKCNDQHLQS
jgi:hypothetical protein